MTFSEVSRKRPLEVDQKQIAALSGVKRQKVEQQKGKEKTSITHVTSLCLALLESERKAQPIPQRVIDNLRNIPNRSLFTILVARDTGRLVLSFLMPAPFADRHPFESSSKVIGVLWAAQADAFSRSWEKNGSSNLDEPYKFICSWLAKPLSGTTDLVNSLRICWGIYRYAHASFPELIQRPASVLKTKCRAIGEDKGSFYPMCHAVNRAVFHGDRSFVSLVTSSMPVFFLENYFINNLQREGFTGDLLTFLPGLTTHVAFSPLGHAVQRLAITKPAQQFSKRLAITTLFINRIAALMSEADKADKPRLSYAVRPIISPDLSIANTLLPYIFKKCRTQFDALNEAVAACCTESGRDLYLSQLSVDCPEGSPAINMIASAEMKALKSIQKHFPETFKNWLVNLKSLDQEKFQNNLKAGNCLTYMIKQGVLIPANAAHTLRKLGLDDAVRALAERQTTPMEIESSKK